MNMAAASPAPTADLDFEAPAGVAVVDALERLDAVRAPDRAAAVWRRDPPAGFGAWIEGLDPAQLPTARGKVSASRAGEAAATLCDKVEMPAGPHRDWLVDDVQRLATAFSQVMRSPRLRLRLDVVTGDACRKFHIDALTARLICTYRGSGTQLGTSPDIDSRAAPTTFVTVPSATPVILRGTLWPETPASGLLHRSPPIEGTGETRLLLVLDPVERSK